MIKHKRNTSQFWNPYLSWLHENVKKTGEPCDYQASEENPSHAHN